MSVVREIIDCFCNEILSRGYLVEVEESKIYFVRGCSLNVQVILFPKNKFFHVTKTLEYSQHIMNYL